MKQITVTSPLLPDLDEFNELIKEIWASKWVTKAYEKDICSSLKWRTLETVVAHPKASRTTV